MTSELFTRDPVLDEDGEALWSTDEAARATRVQRDTLAAMRYRKTGPSYYKIGNRVYYRRSEILGWIAARRVNL